MFDSRTKFYLAKQNAKFKGVCAGVADYTGIDVTLVRIGFVVLALATHGLALIGYGLAAWLAPSKPGDLYQSQDDARFWQGVRSNPTRSAADVRSTFRDLDRRLADIETHFTSRNSALADEIDKLR